MLRMSSAIKKTSFTIIPTKCGTLFWTPTSQQETINLFGARSGSQHVPAVKASRSGMNEVYLPLWVWKTTIMQTCQESPEQLRAFTWVLSAHANVLLTSEGRGLHRFHKGACPSQGMLRLTRINFRQVFLNALQTPEYPLTEYLGN